MKGLASKVKELEIIAKEANDQFREAFMTIPNIPHESVPDGDSETGNQVVSTWGEVEGDFPYAIPHYDIPWFEKMIDFPRGVKVAGAGYPFYLGEMSSSIKSIQLLRLIYLTV